MGVLVRVRAYMFRPGLRNRFILYFLPLMLGMLIQGGYCVHTFATIHDYFEKMQENAVTDVSAMLELRELLLSLDRGIRKRQIDPDQIREKARQLEQIIKAHAGHPHETMSPGDQAAHEMLHHAIFGTTLSRYILARSENGWPKDSRELARIADTIQEELSALESVSDQHLQQHIKQLGSTELFISEQYRHILVVITITCCVVFVLAATVFYLMVRAVIGPVRVLLEGTRQIGAGNMDFHMEITSGDEFEYLAHGFTSMARRLARFHEELDRKVRERTEDLIRTNQELKKAEEQIHCLSRKLLAIQESERQQISLYLHDNVAQNLSSLKIACDSIFLESADGDTLSRQELQEWKGLLGSCIKTVRELSYNLSPPGLEYMGLAGTVKDYCRDFSQVTGIQARFTGVGVDNLRLASDVAINVYRLVQEALNNVSKHANATEVRVELVASGASIILRIEDNGCGFDPEEGYRKALENRRLGLLGMKERVRMIGGRFTIRSAPGQGTGIVIEFPGADYNGDDDQEKT